MDSSLGYHNVGYRRRIGHREEEADIILFGASFLPVRSEGLGLVSCKSR